MAEPCVKYIISILTRVTFQLYHKTLFITSLESCAFYGNRRPRSPGREEFRRVSPQGALGGGSLGSYGATLAIASCYGTGEHRGAAWPRAEIGIRGRILPATIRRWLVIARRIHN